MSTKECSLVYILDSDNEFTTGLSTFVQWGRYNLEPVLCQADEFKLEEKNLFKPGVTICDTQTLINNSDIFMILKKRSFSHKLIILTKEKNVGNLEMSLSLKADTLIEKPVEIKIIENSIQEIWKTNSKLLTHEEATLNEKKNYKQMDSKIENLLYEFSIGDSIQSEKIFDSLLNENFTNDAFVISLLTFKQTSDIQIHNRELKKAIKRILSEIFAEEHRIFFINFRFNELILFIQGKNNTHVKTVSAKLLEALDIIKYNLGLFASASLSEICKSHTDIFKGIDQCQNRILNVFRYGYNLVYSQNHDSSISNAEIFTSNMNSELISAINTGNVNKIAGIMENASSRISLNISNNKIKKQLSAVLVQILALNYNTCDRESLYAFPYYDTIINFAEYCTFSEMHKQIETLAIEIAKNIFNHRHDSQSSAVKTIINYIQQSFNEPISLETAADRVHMSPSHFSRVFKKISGKNFNEFLIDFRLDTAKRLLIETNLKTYEIAEKVGIFDSNYFSRIFKQKFHITPSQYKENKSIEYT